MKVVITVNVDSARHVDLDKRIWENFPEIGGIENYKVSYRQYTLSFELGNVLKEKIQEFLSQEGLTGIFS